MTPQSQGEKLQHAGIQLMKAGFGLMIGLFLLIIIIAAVVSVL